MTIRTQLYDPATLSAERPAKTSVPVTHIRPTEAWFNLHLREVWDYRELLYFLIWRNLKVRYKQTILGVGWILIQPIVTIFVFTLIFGNLAKVPSENLPYPVFSYAALLPWNFFSSALTRAGMGVLHSGSLITKVYFCRLAIPLAEILSGLPDMLISFVVFLALMLYFGIVPTVAIFTLPLFLLLAMATALGAGLWLAALNVRYRDISQLLPFLAQVWMYVSPVVYPVGLVPERWQWLYSLNPMVGVISGFRWALLGKAPPSLGLMCSSMAVATMLLVSGLFYFRRAEDTFADII